MDADNGRCQLKCNGNFTQLIVTRTFSSIVRSLRPTINDLKQAATSTCSSAFKLPLRLPAVHISLPVRLPPEYDGVQVERVLDDTGGGRSHAQDVLLGGQVVPTSYPLQVRQVTVTQEKDIGQQAHRCGIEVNDIGMSGTLMAKTE